MQIVCHKEYHSRELQKVISVMSLFVYSSSLAKYGRRSNVNATGVSLCFRLDVFKLDSPFVMST